MKTRVLIFVRYYLPAYKCGGPVRTIANMVDHLGDQLDLNIVAWDHDSFETCSFPNVAVDSWNRVGAASVFYAAPDFLTYANVSKLLRETPHDVLYLNSFFDPRFTALPLIVNRLQKGATKPVVLAPRGEFSPGALAIRRWKKKLYLSLSRAVGLYRGVTWQASSAHEADDIRRTLGSLAERIVVAPNLPAVVIHPEAVTCKRKKSEGDPVRVVFISRVSPKKNLAFALSVLCAARVPVVFDVYGLVDDDRYWDRCQLAAADLPPHVVFNYRGIVEHDKVHSTFEDYDLFFLPTMGENFGHVIQESLSAGTPVLVSDQTPWRDLDEAGVGWVRSLGDPDAFLRAIHDFQLKSADERMTQRTLARAYAKRVATNPDTVTRNLSLFLEVAVRGNH